MKTVISFLNDQIVVLRGKINRKKVKIKSIKAYDLPDGSLVNGIINDKDAVMRVLEYYKPKSFRMTKKVYTVINSSSIFLKKFKIANTSRKNIQKIVNNNYLTSDEKDSELLVDYRIINYDKESNSNQVLSFAVEKDFVKSYIDIFNKSKIKVRKLDISTNCMVKFTQCNLKLKGRDYIVVTVNEPDIAIYIFVNNKYFYSTKVTIFSRFYTESFYQEVASNILNIIQFNNSQNRDIELKNVYVFGLADDKIKKLKDSVSDIKLNICSNSIFGNVVIFKNKPNEDINYIYNIGALFGK